MEETKVNIEIIHGGKRYIIEMLVDESESHNLLLKLNKEDTYFIGLVNKTTELNLHAIGEVVTNKTMLYTG